MITNDIYDLKHMKEASGFTKACGTGVMASFGNFRKTKIINV